MLLQLKIKYLCNIYEYVASQNKTLKALNDTHACTDVFNGGEDFVFYVQLYSQLESCKDFQTCSSND